MPHPHEFLSPGTGGHERDARIIPPPRFVPDEFVTTQGTRPGACFRVLECLGVDAENRHRWYLIEISGAKVRICESDLQGPVEVVEELGRIVDV